MEAVIVYESLWGNTAAVARAVAQGIGPEARVMSTAEAVLGDDARQPAFIETVHRRGYRYIGNRRSRAHSLRPRAPRRFGGGARLIGINRAVP